MADRPEFSTQPDCVFLVDIAAFLHRAMHVVHRDAVDSVRADDPTSGLHALGMLAGIIDGLGIRQTVVCPDSIEPSLRCDFYEPYKAGRRAHPPVFKENYRRLLTALYRAGVPMVEAPRYEADDIIASFVLGKRDFSVVIVSSDKDLWQLILDGEVTVYDPMQKAWRTRQDCREKFDVDPGQLCDFIGLVGDSSDGIPGVPGFGPKTAANLLRDFGNLDEVYNPERALALSECLSKRQVERLVAHKDDALLSRRLAQPMIWPDCPALGTEMLVRAPTAAALRSVAF